MVGRWWALVKDSVSAFIKDEALTRGAWVYYSSEIFLLGAEFTRQY
jgi:hypothetical protein